MKHKGLNLAGFVLGVVGIAVSATAVSFSTIVFLSNRKRNRRYER